MTPHEDVPADSRLADLNPRKSGVSQGSAPAPVAPPDGFGASAAPAGAARRGLGLAPALLKSMRPHQWTKNVFIFGALIFAQRLDHGVDVLRTAAAFVLFCALSGAVYIFNDLVDLEKDRAHVKKRSRPIASGQIAPVAAAAFGIALAALAMAGAFTLSSGFGVVAVIYLAVNLLYSFYIKGLVILDVMTVALGFVLRAVGGAEVISVPISEWLILCTTLLALFLGFCKRRNELTLLQAAAADHRAILREYSVAFLDQMISVVTASTVIAYAFYAMSPEVQTKLHTRYLGLTVPFVLYGIFRYLYLLNMKGEGGNPAHTLLHDRPLMANVLLWGLTCIALLYFKP